MTWRLSDASSCSFDLNGRDPQSFQVTELGTDVHLLRDGKALYTGRVGSTTHNLDADGHTRSVATADTRALLNRRLTSTERAYTAVDAATVAGDLFSDAQAAPGGALQLEVPTFAPLGVPVTRASAAGVPILKELQETAGVTSGASDVGTLFDWDITPGWVGRRFQLWARRGRVTDVVLDYTWSPENPRSSVLSSVTRTFDPSTYANQVYVTGGVKQVDTGSNATPPTPPTAASSSAPPATAVASSTSVARGKRAVAATPTVTKPPLVSRGTRNVPKPVTQVTDPTSPTSSSGSTGGTISIPTTPVVTADGSLYWSVGVWAAAEGYTDIVEQDELNAKAAARLLELQQVTPTYTVTLVNGFWDGPDHIWLGDTVTVHIDSGSLYEDVSLRVTELSVDLSDDGQETVTLTVGPPAAKQLNALLDAQKRISTLERRR